MTNRSGDWLRQAWADLEHAELSLREGDFEWSCFACQQAAEKGLKGVYFHLHGDPLQGLFSSSARLKFANRREILTIARQTALRIAREHPEVLKIILFGSFARGDYGARSDLDLLVVLAHSDQSPQQRYTDFLRCVSNYPTDLLVLTQAELASRQADNDLFLRRALREGILLYPE